MSIEREENIYRLENAEQVSKSHPHFLELKYIQRALNYAIDNYAHSKVLDIGCGNKPYLNLFNSNPKVNKYIGCDIVQSSNMAVDVLCEATALAFNDTEFDVAFSSQTIEHVADFQKMLQEANRVLKSGGHFILAGPMYWPLHEEPYDFFRFTKHGFEYSLKKAGFDIVEIISCGGKWALMGQVMIHTLPKWLLKPRMSRLLINSIFSILDGKYYDDSNTMNYVVIAVKR